MTLTSSVNVGFEAGGGNKYNFPNVDNDTVVLEDATQTLTNKTLTSPVINTPTGIVKGDVGLGNVDNTSDAAKNSATATLTNKALVPRVTSEASSATPTINTNSTDIHRITALAVDITSMTTNLSGTPTHGQKLMIQFTGTATRAIARGASFADGNVDLPLTTDGTTMLRAGLERNDATSKRECIAAG